MVILGLDALGDAEIELLGEVRAKALREGRAGDAARYEQAVVDATRGARWCEERLAELVTANVTSRSGA